MHKELPRKPREVSSFVANEFLLDYVEDRLDPDRKKAMKAALDKNADTQRKHEQILLASAFCHQLSELQPDQKVLQSTVSDKGWFNQVFQKLRWRSWPDQLRWTSEAFLISCFVALTAYAIPWGQLEEWRAVLSQKLLVRNESPKAEVPNVPPMPAPVITAEKTEKVASTLSGEAAPKIEAVANAQATAKTKAAAEPVTTKPAEVKTIAATTTGAKLSVDKPAVAKSPEAKPAEAKLTELQTAAPEPTAQPLPQGELYRVAMKLPGIETKVADFTAKILELGGTKAGQVQLGWRKPNGNYFHFALPQANYTALMQFLGAHASVRMNKIKHTRVMPEGQIRVILWIEDGVQPTIGDIAVEGEPVTPPEESADPDLPPGSGDGE